jgi:phosphohistidine phosphatase
MKQLIIVRHAKSSLDDPSLDDFDRPLNERGLRDAPEMAKRLREKRFKPDHILSSSALRTKLTASLMSNTIGQPDNLTFTKKLYFCSPKECITLVSKIKDKIKSLMIVSHNTMLEELIGNLSKGEITHFPTCSVAIFEFDIDSWKSIKVKKAILVHYDFPKNKK